MSDTIILVLVLANVLLNSATPAATTLEQLSDAFRRFAPSARDVLYHAAILALMFALPVYVVRLIFKAGGS